MKAAKALINEIFEVEINEDEIEKRIENVLEWNSFMIMNFMAEMSERYHAEISVDDISGVETIDDLLDLIIERRK